MASGSNKVSVASSSAPTPKGAISISIFASGTSIGQNRLYVLASHQDSEASPDVVMSMLKLFSCDMYYLLDLGSTLSYVIAFVAVHFGFGPKFIFDPFFCIYPNW